MIRAFVTVVALALAAPAVSQSASSHPARSGLLANRVILRVSDLPKSVDFYRDRVGLPLTSESDEFAVFDTGGLSILLQQSVAAPAAPSTGLASYTEVVMESPDIFVTYHELRERGVDFRIEPRIATTDGTRDLYTADFRDPDGHLLSIVGWMPHP
jgi:resuscitation-promoting factor RpfA